MLIDARHSEETRVTIVKGNRVEDFDYESSTRRQLKGNIYLARVTRVEPSLQAAFVEYGGNRHGFLAFSEIHPDYYQIPAKDRDELIAAELAVIQQQQVEEEARFDNNTKDTTDNNDAVNSDVDQEENGVETPIDDEASDNDEISDEIDEVENIDGSEDDDIEDVEIQDINDEERDQELAEARARRYALKAMKRKYSIQEVIKKRQVLLIQVAKEERGNKGAALTTYLSLAGRYCVLMPNSTHSGGISRKISNSSDRRKLKNIISSLNVDNDMGLIIRTAGLKRTKSEIKRDYEYLLRLWNEIRDLTLQSIAPTLVYEEANLIKRTIRDQYTRDIDEVLVEGERGYRAAKDFMKLLMPSHSKKVQHYKDHIPLFHRYQVESHLEAMYQPIVQLKSGGYIVINPTEALISIDVNSGRSTKEHNIEETAIKTNLEAAEEVARQLKLRDMAGLVVIDFIDMEERGNNRSVERRMKEVLKSDRARIQIGRISSFGLMEMSRQRLRPNLLEASMETCPSCEGTGVVRSIESAALTVLRNLEEEGIRARSSLVRVTVCPDVAVYLLNKKRKIIADLENRYHFYVEVLAKSDFGPSNLEITREAATADQQAAANAAKETVVSIGSIETAETTESINESSSKKTELDDEKPQKKRRRRRRKRRGEDTRVDDTDNTSTTDDENNDADSADSSTSDEGNEETQKDRTRRRRGRRGGRNRNRQEQTNQASNEDNPEAVPEETATKQNNETSGDIEALAPDTDTDNTVIDQNNKSGEKPKTRRRKTRKIKKEPASEESSNDTTGSKETPDTDDTNEKPKRRRRRVKRTDDNETTSTSNSSASSTESTTGTEEKEKPKRKPRTRKKQADSETKVSAEPAKEDKNNASDEKADDKPKPLRRKQTQSSKAVSAKSQEEPVKKAEKAKAVDEIKDKSTPIESSIESTEVKVASPIKDSKDSAPKRKGWWQRTFG
jgi:ribonuclease E